MADISDESLLTGDEKILAEAKRRFRECETWESDFRKAFLDDIKFANADSVNMYAWPNDIRRNRDIDERPCLTVNKTHQHCLQIQNDAKKNKPGVKVRPTGGEATFESAQALEDVIRHIEYMSNAQSAYDKATEFQVQGGIGYWRVITAYASEEVSVDAFDQDIFIRPIKDPLNVFLDPDINEIDGSDAKYGFVFDTMAKDEFKRKYPKFEYVPGSSVLGSSGDNWITEDHVRIAEYYRKVDNAKTIVAYVDSATQETKVIPLNDIPKSLRKLLLSEPTTKTRKITEPEIEWYLLAGDQIIDRNVWPGKYVPIVRIIGEETIIDGSLDRKGHTRALRDPQRIYNYWTSSAVEFVALQGKQPFIGAARAIEGYETYWETANRVNYSILPYNDTTDDGTPIPPPARDQPPQMADAYVKGMQISANEMMMVSGQYQAVMGAQSNETSGKAINERQRQGETATYHFIDNLAIGIRYTGKILLDLIPKIYDTPRIIRIMAEDGTENTVSIDPTLEQAHKVKKDKITNQVTRLFNPNMGKYDVESDIGPSYGTKRQEAYNALTQIASQSPQMMGIVGDLLFKSADFPGADEIAERLHRMVPGQALGTEAPPELAHMQQMMQNMQQFTGKLLETINEQKLELKKKEAETDVNQYKAITDRLKALLPTMINPKDIAQNIMDLMALEKQNAHEMMIHKSQLEADSVLSQQNSATQGV